MVVAHVESADSDTTQAHRQAQDRAYAVRAERGGKIGPAPFRGHIGAGDDLVGRQLREAARLPAMGARGVSCRVWQPWSLLWPDS
jgi:hypothetical protein